MKISISFKIAFDGLNVLYSNFHVSNQTCFQTAWNKQTKKHAGPLTAPSPNRNEMCAQTKNHEANTFPHPFNTSCAFAKKSSTSPSGGNQVDGLPPASSEDYMR